MTTLLVTGFGPFPGWPRNPTPAMVKAVAALRRPGLRIVPHVFGTVYAEVARDLPALIARHRPDAVLLFGLAGRTGHIRLERQAHNVTSRRAPDASGAFHPTAEIAAGGPRRVATAVRAGALAARLRRAGLNAHPSPSAGEYLCNFAYWLSLEAVARRQVKRALFVHVPLPARAAPARRTARRPALARRLSEADLARAAVATALMLAGRPAPLSRSRPRCRARAPRP